jgi:streptogramin lyase/methionine-rich copper-binding protein CopC
VTENASAPTVLNSIFAFNNTGVLTLRDSKPVITYSNTFGNRESSCQTEELVNGNWQRVQRSAIPGDTNMVKDPMFVDAPLLNLRLAAGSPMIDAGDPSTYDPVDTRSRADLGAMPAAEGQIAAADRVPPTVVATTPLAGSYGAPLSGPITATFDEAINPATVTDRSFTLADASGNHVPGVVAYNQATKTASFTPAAPLAAGALYSASVGAAVQDLAGNALPVPFMWSFATSGGAAAPGAQPDLALRTAEESGFAGVGVYASVEGQTKAQAVRYGSPAVYHVRVTNAGSAAQTVELLGAAGDEQWTVDYYDALSGGNKITADVTGSSGWLTRTLAPGDSVMVRAEVTPAITAPGGSSKDVFVAAIASSAPGFRDICRLVTTSLPVSKVNAMIRSADDVNYTGGDLYNATAEGQRDVQAADAGATVVYHVQAVNEGNAAYALTLSGPGSGDGWSIRYFDALVGGTEISKVVASGGYVSPALAPGRAVEIRVEVTPSSAVPEGSTKDVVISVSPGADRNAVDAVCASVLVTAPKAVAVGGTYTLDQEFDLGVLAGVEHTSVHDQLQLSKEAVTLPFIWVPNSNEGTVSKVDTRTGRELGRYRVSPQANSSPSRTTVDLQGNCWVANRLTGTVVKIGLLENGQYVDRNGDGIIQTSRDLNGDGDITIDEVLPWGQDECVLVETIVIPGKEGAYVPGTYTGEYANNDQNPGPRGIAVDRGNNVWIGTHDSRMFYYLDGATGRILRSIDVSSVDHTSYGAVIDGQGILWSSGIDKNHVLRLDPATGQFSVVPVGHTVYGLGLDRANHLFIAGWQSSKLTCINVLTGQKEWTRDGIYESRGVAVTSDGDVWVANSGPGTVARWSPDGVFKAQIPVGSQPTGVSVDASGKVWAVNLGDESIERIDPLTNTVDLRKTIKGASHYGYSDMTGMVSRTVTTRTGTWTVVHDGRAVGAKWASVSWHAATPDGTSVSVAVRSSDDRRGWSDWEAVASGARLNSTPNGRYLQVRVTLQASASGSSPVLYDLTVVPADTTPPQVVSVVPAPGTIGVLPTTSVSASFSEAMDPASISASTFVLVDQRGVAVPATVQYDANRYVAVLQPAVPLAYSTAYTARISQGATDLAGNQLATAAVWGFTTAPAPDTVPPTVVATVPANGAVSAPADKPITITFSEPLDPRTVTDAAISLVNWSGGAVVAYDQASKTVTLTPGAKLWYNTTYTVIVRPVLTDLAGNVMAAPYTWSFTTAPAVDTMPPEVTSTTPAKDARDVPADAAIAATFSEPVKADTLTTSTFTLQDASGGPVAGSVTYDDKKRTATLKPGGKLSAGAVYTATLTAGVTDEAGNALASYSWSFTVAKETPSVLVGDLNGDGRVGISDATIALRIAVGLRVPTSSELAAGDLNGDGRISIAEVTRVLRIALGL